MGWIGETNRRNIDSPKGWSDLQELAMIQAEVKAPSRRMREVKQGIKKLEKLMSDVSNLQTTIQLVLNELHSIQGVILVLSSSPVCTLFVYKMLLPYGMVVSDHIQENYQPRKPQTPYMKN